MNVVKSWVESGRVIEGWAYKHPLFPSRDTISRSRRVMAEYLCRSLGRNDNVHHKNGDTLDDRMENLELKSCAEHSRDHMVGNKHGLGHSHTEEVRSRISAKLKGIPKSDVMKAKLREKNLGKVISEDTRQKISIALKGRPGPVLSVDARKRISESLKGHVVSEETRRKISITKKARLAALPEPALRRVGT